ncbi:Sodium/hydrogen exchanger family-domain-containing protein [Trametes polyzona]|nr:Sodium/hydrogen exchanger family-domain-containing protein [Trametes polyzona]
MHIQLLQLTDSGLAYTVVGGFVVAFSMVSLLVKEKLFINEVVLGTACGIIFGPFCLNVLDPRAWGGDTNTITLEVTRLTLAAGLFAIGVELPPAYIAKHVKGLLVMVVPTMAFGWVVGAALIHAIFPALDFVSALVVAACLTPTDPVISATIVGGTYARNHVPENIRHIISAESAANDGLAYPFLSISVYLTTEASRRVAIEKWFLVGWLYEVVLGVVIGAALGIVFSFLMKFSHRKGFIDRESYVAQYLALTLFTIGITRTLGSDDLLAAFAVGCAINWDGYFSEQTENEVFSHVVDLLLNCGCFVYIGAWMPFNMFNAPELGITPWRLVVLFLAILVLRRIPPLLLLYKWVPEITTWREALFSGHFGPMGVGAIFISTLAVTELPAPQRPPQGQAELLAATLQTIVSFVVLGSIIIHGLSIPFVTVGKDLSVRTLSVTRTWTSHGRTGAPDWMLSIRRRPSDTSIHLDTLRADVEHGEDVDKHSKGASSASASVAGDPAHAAGLLQPGDVAARISDATVAPALPRKVDVHGPSAIVVHPPLPPPGAHVHVDVNVNAAPLREVEAAAAGRGSAPPKRPPRAPRRRVGEDSLRGVVVVYFRDMSTLDPQREPGAAGHVAETLCGSGFQESITQCLCRLHSTAFYPSLVLALPSSGDVDTLQVVFPATAVVGGGILPTDVLMLHGRTTQA